MIETYYVGTYWGPRRESADECARRAQAFFQAMAECDPLFSRWFKPPRSRKHASTPLALDVPILRELFSNGRTLNDEGRVIEDLGFRILADSGQWPATPSREFSGFNVKCGGYAEHVPNSCVLNLPSTGAPMERLVQGPVLETIMRAMILAWEPDWGVVNSSSHLLLDNSPSSGLYAGWMMYLSDRQGALPALPAPVRVESVEGKGTLLILTPDRFTASNPEHVALAARVRETLTHAGL